MIPNERPVIANSLWTATANRMPDFPPLEGQSKTDVVVVGGGFSGLSTALHLAEAGVNVTLLEGQQPGWGASGRNGGQINVGLKDAPSVIRKKFGTSYGNRMIEMSGQAGDLVFDLIAKHNIQCDAIRPGWLRAAHTPKTLSELHALAQEWQELGADVRPLDRDGMANLTGTADYLGGLIDMRGGNLQPFNYAVGLADAAERQGAVIHGGSAVTKIEKTATGHRVHAAHGAVEAPQVVLCTNAYSNKDLHANLSKSVLPVRSVQVATKPLSDNIRKSILPELHALSDARRLLLYFRLDAEGRFLMGGRGTYNDTSTRRQFERLKKVTAKLYPQLADVEWDYAWGGFVALTRDHYAHLHEIAPGLKAGLGYNGRGVAIATAMGRVLAQWAQGTPEDELAFPVTTIKPLPFSFARETMVEAEILRLRLLDKLGV
ncbi:MAG: FAD-binding oxidoreductase [Pseudomonadota bacterium]